MLTEEEKEICRQLKSEHGAVKPFRAPEPERILIVIRKCKPGERDRLISKMKKDEDARAIKEIALSCVVHPDIATVRSICEEWPGLYDTFGSAAYELAGGDVEDLGNF